jgi:hypothetical protein
MPLACRRWSPIAYRGLDARPHDGRRTEGSSRCPSTGPGRRFRSLGVLVSLVVPDVLEAGCTTRQALKEAPPQHVAYELTVLGRTLPEPPAAGYARATGHP